MKPGMNFGKFKKSAPRHADAVEEKSEPVQESPKEETAEDVKKRIGFKDASKLCETCSHYDEGQCSKYSFPSDPEDSCEEGWTDSEGSDETTAEKGGGMLDGLKGEEYE